MASIFIGGMGDGVDGSRIVVNYCNTYATSHPGAKYFDWDDKEAILNYMNSLSKDEPINLIGHSYGGDTAGNIAAHYSRTISLLITIDPVGHTRMSTFGFIKGNCTMWVDVNAVPPGWFNASNYIAAIGSYWGDDPKDFATIYVEAPFNHEQFPELMRAATENGQSAALILERSGVGAAN